MKSSWTLHLRRFFGRIFVAGLAGFLSGCASVPRQDITAVPKIETSRLSAPQLAFLKTRQFRVIVTDQRAPEFHLNSDAIVTELTRALTDVFEHQGFTVSATSGQIASLQVQDDVDQTEARVNGVKKKSYCVKLLGTVELPGQRFINANASSCHQIHDSLGIQQGGDISRAYEKALNLIFEKWDELGTQTFGRI